MCPTTSSQWRSGQLEQLKQLIEHEPGRAAHLARAVLADANGLIPRLEDAVRDETSAKVLCLLCDCLFDLLQAAGDHFDKVLGLAKGTVLEIPKEDSAAILSREPKLMVPAILVADLLAEALGSEAMRFKKEFKDNLDVLGRFPQAGSGAKAFTACWRTGQMADQYLWRALPERPPAKLPRRVPEDADAVYLTEWELTIIVGALREASPKAIDLLRRTSEAVSPTLGANASSEIRLIKLDDRIAKAIEDNHHWSLNRWDSALTSFPSYTKAMDVLVGILDPVCPTTSAHGSSEVSVTKGEDPEFSCEISLESLGYDDEPAIVLCPSDGDRYIEILFLGPARWRAASLYAGSLVEGQDPAEASRLRADWERLIHFDSCGVFDGHMVRLSEEALGKISVRPDDTVMVSGGGDELLVWERDAFNEEMSMPLDELMNAFMTGEED